MPETAVITDIRALEVLDSRGNPTLEVFVEINHGEVIGEAKVPSGASTGAYEAVELRDGEKDRYHGKGVREALRNVEEKILPELLGVSTLDQAEVDALMIELDGTENKSGLGANAMLGVSLAVARAGSQIAGLPLYQYLGGLRAGVLPVPLLNVLNGGAHADNGLDIQEFMLIPAGFDTFAEALRAGVESYHSLHRILKDRKLSTGLGDEGGFAPVLPSHEAALDLLIEAIAAAGYRPGEQIWLGIDAAATEFATPAGYRWNTGNASLTASELAGHYREWAAHYPLISFEDPFGEGDWQAWNGFTADYGSQFQIVGDDLFVTNPERLARGLEEGSANAILIKLNQIGTLTETLRVIEQAQRSGWGTVISHRSGETDDTFIADLAVAVNAGQIKTGAPARGERTAKYNRLLEIAWELEDDAHYAGTGVFGEFARVAKAPA